MAACRQPPSTRPERCQRASQATVNAAGVASESAQGQLTEAQARINYLLEQIVLARHRMFGASSEQSPDQVRLFDEAEVLAAAPEADEDAPEDEADPSSEPKAKARGKRAPLPAELPRVDIVHELPEDQRQVIVLREVDGLSYKEISEVLEVPEGTVMSRLFYARRKLQNALSEERA